MPLSMAKPSVPLCPIVLHRSILRCLLIAGLLSALSTLSLSALATSTDWTPPVETEEASDTDLGFEFDMTPGLGQPLGEGSQYYDPGFHFGLTTGLRIGPGLVGIQFDYTPLAIDPPDGRTVSGSSTLLMASVAGKVHAVPDGLFDPVFGAHVGYFDLSAQGPGGEADISGLAFGADVRLLFRLPVADKGPSFLVGPNVGVSMLVATETCLNDVCGGGSDDAQGYLQGGLVLGFEYML